MLFVLFLFWLACLLVARPSFHLAFTTAVPYLATAITQLQFGPRTPTSGTLVAAGTRMNLPALLHATRSRAFGMFWY